MVAILIDGMSVAANTLVISSLCPVVKAAVANKHPPIYTAPKLFVLTAIPVSTQVSKGTEALKADSEKIVKLFN